MIHENMGVLPNSGEADFLEVFELQEMDWDGIGTVCEDEIMVQLSRTPGLFRKLTVTECRRSVFLFDVMCVGMF